MADAARLEVERAALALLDDLLDLPESARQPWIDARTADEAVKARLAAMLEADRISSLRTGAAALGLADRPLPPRIGQYRITGLIGRGGMGAVYRGVRATGDFEHEVAIKLVKPGLLSEQLAERFREERRTLATLSHPNIASLFDGGETADGSPFIVMELVDGVALDRWAAERGLNRDARLLLLESVADAVSHAHARLVVHRDLTPLNVLVTADGTVKLIDFGISRASDIEGATTAVDIAGLGRLTNRLFPAPEPEQAAVIARACDPDTGRRYPTADAFAADLKALRTGYPVSAAEGGRSYRWGKFVRRNKAAMTAASAAVMLLLGALGAVSVANRQAQAAQAQAQARFEQTRAIANAMLFDAFDAVSRVPGSTEARQTLAETAVPYLDELAAMKEAPADVRAEAGRGYVRLAEVVGGGQAGSLGRYADANALLARAEALLVPLYLQYPSDPAVVLAYAALRLEQAGVDLYNNNNADRARERGAEAEAVLKRTARDSSETARMTATAMQMQGDSFGWNDDYSGALPHHLRAEAWMSGLPGRLAVHRDVMAARSANLRLLAEAHHKEKQGPQARAANDAAVAVNRRLVALNPADPVHARKLALALWYAGVVHRTNMRDAEARAAITEALALAQGLAARDPADLGALKTQAIVGEVMAQILADARDARASIEMSDAVIAMHERLVTAAGDTPGALRSLTAALRTSGGNRYNLGDIAGACAIWKRTADNYRALERRGQLTKFDRNNGRPETDGFLRNICLGGMRPAEI